MDKIKTIIILAIVTLTVIFLLPSCAAKGVTTEQKNPSTEVY